MSIALQTEFAASRARRVVRELVFALCIACFAALEGCATFDQEIYVAPLYSQHSRAGGEVETELIAGAIRTRRRVDSPQLNHWALRPIVSRYVEANDDSITRFLVPLGTITNRGTEHVNQLLPIWRYQSDVDEFGNPEWKFISLPGVFWSQDARGRIVRAVFPFGGVVEDFATFDRIVFVLFPVFLYTDRDGRKSWNFLFPIFNYTTGTGGSCSRIWPLYGHNSFEGMYDRWFFLWPFFHFEHNDLGKPEGAREDRWMFWPLIGHSTRGTFSAWTFLWPFFGYAHDPASDFWAWDGPWPFVRINRGGKHPPSEERTRVWPLYSKYVGDGLEKKNFLWPIMQFNVENYPSEVRHSEYVLPFWQRWTTTAATGEKSSWEKLWPLYQLSSESEGERFAFPALSPLWNLPTIDDQYAWIYELWTNEKHGRVEHERMWGGICRSERDEFEERSYVLGIWSSRRYVEHGERVESHSLFFGLLRWSWRKSRGAEMLLPAVPGPGWPLERSHEPLPVEPDVVRDSNGAVVEGRPR